MWWTNPPFTALNKLSTYYYYYYLSDAQFYLKLSAADFECGIAALQFTISRCDWLTDICLFTSVLLQCTVSAVTHVKRKPIAGCMKWHAPHTHWNVNATNKLNYRRLNSLENLNSAASLLYAFYFKHFIVCIRLASISCLTAITMWTPD